MVVRVNYLCGGSRECGNRANCNDRRIVLCEVVLENWIVISAS